MESDGTLRFSFNALIKSTSYTKQPNLNVYPIEEKNYQFKNGSEP